MDTPKTLRAPLFIGLGLLGLVYAVWGICDTLTELGGDSATYMLMARGLSPFVPADPMLAQVITAAAYPPLFPLLIGLLGAGFTAAHGLVIGALLLAFFLMYRMLRAQQLNAVKAAVAVALFAAMPGTYLLALNIWSENPYLACSLLTLCALESAAIGTDRSGNDRNWWIAVIASSAAMMIRTGGLPLLATFTLFAALRRPRRWLCMIVAAWLPFAAWAGLLHAHDGGVGEYTRQLVSQYAHDPLGHLSGQLRIEGRALLNAWYSAWLGYIAPKALSLLICTFGLLCLLGWMLRLRLRRADAVYSLLYLLMLLVWPWPGEAPRLLYVIMPLLIGYGLHAVRDLSGWMAHRATVVRATFLGLLAMAVLPGVLVTVQRWLAPLAPGLEVSRHIAGYYSDDVLQERRVAHYQALIITALPGLAAEVPPADCIFQIKPSVVELLTGRRSAIPPLPATDDRSFAQQIRQCRYAYVMLLQSPTFPMAFYPRNRLGAQYHVIRQLPDDTSPDGEVLAELIELSPSPP